MRQMLKESAARCQSSEGHSSFAVFVRQTFSLRNSPAVLKRQRRRFSALYFRKVKDFMNILHTYTVRALKANRTRTIVTIVGVILSAAMFTAVTTFLSSLQHYMLDVVIYNDGDWHACLYGTSENRMQSLKEREEVSRIACAREVGYARLEGAQNDYKPYLYVEEADDTFFDVMPVHLTAGRLPENSSEILLPEHLKTNGGVKKSLGDTLMLSLGVRIASDGEKLDQFIDYHNNDNGITETLKTSIAKVYTVVGFYERPSFESYSAPGYTALTRMETDAARPDALYHVYFKLDNVKDTYSFLDEESEAGGFVRMLTNTDVLLYSGVSGFENFYAVLYSLGTILILLIMFGSISLIYNAFSISVSERTRQFGLLSSVGATKKQIRKSVLFEACCIGLVGIPIGILCGIAGIGITLYTIGGAFSSLFNGQSPQVIALHVNVLSVAVAAAVALLTILLSAWIPARRATKITAIEAIRQTGDISADQKLAKTSRLTLRLFGLEGALAKKYFKRSRKKYRATVLSLFMSIVLFVSANAFCTYLTDSVSGVFDEAEYDIVYHLSEGIRETMNPEDIYAAVSGTEGVKRSSLLSYTRVSAVFDSKVLSEQYLASGDGSGYVPIYLYSVDDGSYAAYLSEHGYDPSVYMNPDKPVGIASSALTVFNTDKGKFESFDAFAEKPEAFSVYYYDWDLYEELTPEERETYDDMPIGQRPYERELPLTVGAYADDLAFGCNSNSSAEDSVVIMYPESVIRSVVDSEMPRSWSIYFEAENHKEVFEKLSLTLEENALAADTLFDVAASGENDRNLVMILNVFSYGFIILISLIAAVNVFHTISTNIGLRRREFAMLRSVGMTSRGLNRMMNYECLLYGCKSLLLGLPVSLFITWLIFQSVNQGYQTAFYVPFPSIAIAVTAVFTVVFTSMLYSMNKIKKDNVIDALKNENL